MVNSIQEGTFLGGKTEVFSHSEQETEAIGRSFGEKASPGLILGLNGELGSGKTVFIRGFVRGFLKDPEIQVRSPSYVLQHIYGQGFRRVYHMDLYRIFKYEDLIGAGLLEGFEDQEGAVCIEWAERIRDDLPKTKMLYVRFEHIDLDKRRLTVGW